MAERDDQPPLDPPPTPRPNPTQARRNALLLALIGLLMLVSLSGILAFLIQRLPPPAQLPPPAPTTAPAPAAPTAP
jgi:hypothetical protein